MSAANTPDPLARPPAADAWVGDLAHELRQPLSTIQSAVCYLKLILRGNERALAHLNLIEEQVCDADGILQKAVASARKDSAHPAGSAASGNFELTKVATADVA
jgi:hypothetical protein